MPEIRKSVLVVDDHVALVNATARTLQAAGYSVDTCYNGGDAQKKLEVRAFDFLITDYFMPIKNGLELVDYLCSRGANTGVILITSHHNNEEMLRRIRAHPKSMVLVKPFPSQKVLESLKELEEKIASIPAEGGPLIRPEGMANHAA
jgi:DNA-binding NtrC family response regulator